MLEIARFSSVDSGDSHDEGHCLWGERRGLWWGGIGCSDGRVWGRNGGVGIPMARDIVDGEERRGLW